MEEILKLVFSEQGFIGMLLLLTLGGIGYGFYKIGTILVSLLGKTLTNFLEKFDEMVNSIISLSKNEIETKKVHTEEHSKIMDILINIRNDMKIFHKDIKKGKKD